jgi:nitrogen regulatory protein PII
MKLIRCVVPPCHVDEVVDALKTLGDVHGLTVTGGGGWHERQPPRRTVYRGCEYERRLQPEILIDVTTPDYAVDDVVHIVADRCSMGQTGDDTRILVMPVEDWREIRARQQRRTA